MYFCLPVFVLFIFWLPFFSYSVFKFINPGKRNKRELNKILGFFKSGASDKTDRCAFHSFMAKRTLLRYRSCINFNLQIFTNCRPSIIFLQAAFGKTTNTKEYLDLCPCMKQKTTQAELIIPLVATPSVSV